MTTPRTTVKNINRRNERIESEIYPENSFYNRAVLISSFAFNLLSAKGKG